MVREQTLGAQKGRGVNPGPVVSCADAARQPHQWAVVRRNARARHPPIWWMAGEP